ncbi:glycosyltransferase [Chlorobaculum sp. 24CR]|jgi:glycosyltransferase involved in cell wall biosynthesis|uniref:glycosyltransferase n=1 Tax=Chlorobaculum sp. 24CR TaxID=2508878 RepID=UPI00100A76F5|nr:glycosyltransferase [Chlorobaculum sp. 24CR]RXK88718.1 glycosyltransferase [Chlorobaculum sp. 24CR]
MNILFTCSARKWGGNEAWVLNAAQVLGKKHDVSLAYRADEVGNRFTVDKYRLPFMNEADLLTLGRLVSIIRQRRIDVVVPTKRKDYFLAGIACRITGAKNILILGIVRSLEKTLVNNLVYNILADGIMVNAQTIKEVLLQSPFMKPEKIAVIPNGISIDRGGIVPVKKAFDFMVTSLAELSERKGFDFLIRGFARFVKEHGIADAGLLIMGSGGQREKLEALTESLGVKRFVIFAGFVKNPYPDLLASDVFALTSKNEGIPYAIIEAALLDNAIITTRAGGTEELLEDNEHCLYVDYGDESQLATRFHRLYEDKNLRTRLSGNAREITLERFSSEKMEKEMIAFFQKIRN